MNDEWISTSPILLSQPAPLRAREFTPGRVLSRAEQRAARKRGRDDECVLPSERKRASWAMSVESVARPCSVKGAACSHLLAETSLQPSEPRQRGHCNAIDLDGRDDVGAHHSHRAAAHLQHHSQCTGSAAQQPWHTAAASVDIADWQREHWLACARKLDA